MSTESGRAGVRRLRRRNAVLAAIETARARHAGLTITNLLVLLYVAENEGLSISELALVCGFNKPTASRAARSLGSRSDRGALPPYLGLVSLCSDGPTRNSRTLRLTAAGQALCDRIDAHIVAAVTIRDRPARTGR